MKTLLEVDQLHVKTPEGRSLFSGLSFNLRAGELLHIHGCNGSGKSTLLKAILGQYKYYEGTIKLNARNSETSLLPQMGNIQFLLPYQLRNVIHTKVPGASDPSITSLGLLSDKHLSLAWNTASGGERQKALLTRCLLAQGSLLVLDEPFNHLDAKSKIHLVEKMGEAQKSGRTVILNSHEASLDHGLSSQQINLQDYMQ